MKLQVILSAVAIAAFAGTAHAQNTTGTTGATSTGVAGTTAGAVGANGFNTGFNNGFTNNGFVNPFQFVPNAGFVPPGGVVNPFTGAINNGFNVNGFNNGGFTNGFNGATGFAPGPGSANSLGIDPTTGQPINSVGGGSLFNGFTPGFGAGGYYGGYGYDPYGYGGAVNLNNPYGNYGGGYGNYGQGMARRGGLPILGLNVPATAMPRTRRARVRQLEPTNDQRLTDTPDGVVVTNPAGSQSRTAADFGVVTSAANMMASDRPLRGARLKSVSGRDASVEYSINGLSRMASVPLSEVFYFRGDGEMATLAQNSRAVRAGGAVMVADPMQSTQPAQLVAGSRQSYGKMKVTNKITSHKKSTKKSRSTRHRTR